MSAHRPLWGIKNEGTWDTKAAGEYSPTLCHALAKYIAVTQPVVASEKPKGASSASEGGPRV